MPSSTEVKSAVKFLYGKRPYCCTSGATNRIGPRQPSDSERRSRRKKSKVERWEVGHLDCDHPETMLERTLASE